MRRAEVREIQGVFTGPTAKKSEQDKVRHRGIGDESRARDVYAKLESNSEPERARVCMPESGSESQ